MISNNIELLVVLGLYVIHYKTTGRLLFIGAFLFTEIFAISAIPNYLSGLLLSLFYASIYCLVYFISLTNEDKFATKASIIVAIFLDVGSMIDVTFFPKDETMFYGAYPILYVLVHLCIILSFVDRRSLQRIMGKTINTFSSVFCCIYARSLFWYNLRKPPEETEK